MPTSPLLMRMQLISRNHLLKKGRQELEKTLLEKTSDKKESIQVTIKAFSYLLAEGAKSIKENHLMDNGIYRHLLTRNFDSRKYYCFTDKIIL